MRTCESHPQHQGWIFSVQLLKSCFRLHLCSSCLTACKPAPHSGAHSGVHKLLVQVGGSRTCSTTALRLHHLTALCLLPCSRLCCSLVHLLLESSLLSLEFHRVSFLLQTAVGRLASACRQSSPWLSHKTEHLKCTAHTVLGKGNTPSGELHRS